MTKEDWIKEQFKDDNFSFRLGVLSQRSTGLPMVILTDTKGLDNRNYPRLLFNDAYTESWEWETLIPISLDKKHPEIMLENVSLNISAHDISILKEWIIKHYDCLMNLWNGDIDILDFCNMINNNTEMK